MPSNGTTLELDIELFGIISTDSSRSKINVKIAMRQWWVDERLTWNPEDYDGISGISMFHDTEKPRRCLWTPDLETYTNTEAQLDLLKPNVYV